MLKKMITRVSGSLFNDAPLKAYRGHVAGRTTRALVGETDYYFSVHYKKRMSSLLSSLCDTHGSDKGEIRPSDHTYTWHSHTYADVYERLFDHCRQHIVKVFECGLGTSNPEIISNMTSNGRPGASLRVWRDYFPNAQVFGADIDRGSLFQENRIMTFYVDQTDPKAVSEMWSQIGVKAFDLIIDDGLHTYEAGVSLFENSIDNLGENGIYTIEDITTPDLIRFKDYFRHKNFSVDFITLKRPNTGLWDNNMVMIRRNALPT